MTELIGSDYRYLFKSFDNTEQIINSLLEKIDIFLKDFALKKCKLPKLQKEPLSIEDLGDYMLKLYDNLTISLFYSLLLVCTISLRTCFQ